MKRVVTVSFWILLSVTNSSYANSVSRQVLIYSGGFRSCTSDINRPEAMDHKHYWPMIDFKESLEKKLGSKNPIRWILSCAQGPGINSRVFDEAEQSQTLGMSISHSFDSKQFATFLMKQLSDQPTDIYWFGHSYGGWLAAKTALQVFSKSTNIRIALLATSDPINANDCPPSDAAGGLLGLSKPTVGCTQFPGDVTKDIERHIASTNQPLPKWLNFYQTQTVYLHSGEAKGATNIKLHFAGFPEKTKSPKPHQYINNSSYMWNEILNSAN